MTKTLIDTCLIAYFQNNLDKLLPKNKTIMDLNEVRNNRVLRWQWYQLAHVQTICISFQTDNHAIANTSSLDF